jgi:hypothetical protein
MRYTNYTTECTEDAYVEPEEEYDYGGGSYENWDPTPIITDCQGTPDGTATWSNDCNTCIGGSTGITNCSEMEAQFKNFDDNIEDSLTHKCLKTLLDSIKNLKSGRIAEIIYNFSRDIPNWHWKVKEGTISGLAHAVTKSPPLNGTITTTFDFNKLKGATNLAVVRTFMHEAVHAYLATYFYTDPVKFNLDYPEQLKWFYKTKNPDLNDNQHNLMIKRFVGDIGLALKQYGEQIGLTIDSQIYMDLAWGGLDYINNTSLTDDEKERINNRIAAEQTNSLFADTSPSGLKLLCN